jgi:tetraacyldisaccharide 4'-kinase
MNSMIRSLLKPAALLYELIVRLRNWMYTYGWIKIYRVPVPVISIGNITLGGTGKTPVTISIAKQLVAAGKKTAVISRGYGRRSSGVVVVSDGIKLLCSAEESGDEPYLIAARVPEAVVIVAARRVDAAYTAVNHYGCDVILLDDGFQHRAMGRNCDIVLIDCNHELLRDCMFPAGSLREPLSGLKRANVIVFTNIPPDLNHSDGCMQALSTAMAQLSPDAAQCQCQFIPSGLFPVFKAQGGQMQLGELQNKAAVAFCGIAKPDRFFSALDSLGVQTVVRQTYGDHYWYKDADIREIKHQLENSGSNLIVTTAKDAVRLQSMSSASREIVASLPLWYLDIDTIWISDILSIVSAYAEACVDTAAVRSSA